MPIYEYQCQQCDHVFERLVGSMKERSAPPCPKCQGVTKRRLSVFATHNSSSSTACGMDGDACPTAQGGGCTTGQCPFAG